MDQLSIPITSVFRFHQNQFELVSKYFLLQQTEIIPFRDFQPICWTKTWTVPMRPSGLWTKNFQNLSLLKKSIKSSCSNLACIAQSGFVRNSSRLDCFYRFHNIHKLYTVSSQEFLDLRLSCTRSNVKPNLYCQDLLEITDNLKVNYYWSNLHFK